MQEEVENKVVNLAITTTRLTVRTLISGLRMYIGYRKHKKMHDPYKHGKQSVKQLIKQGQGATSMVIGNESLKLFERIARKYGVDYAVTKDRSVDPPNYTVFFKARDADALTAAFKENSAQAMRKEKRPSVLKQLKKFKALVASIPDKVRNKDKEHSL